MNKVKAGSIATKPSSRLEQGQFTPPVILPQNHKPRPVMVDTPHGKRCVGEIDGRLFRKKVKKSCHLMRALDAWAVQAEVVERAQKEGIDMVVVEDVESGVTYLVPLDLLRQKGIQRDFGHGPQIFLPRRFWNKEAFGQHQLALWEDGARR
ncbi:hypothetical protein HKBW3S43_01449 [Candidatus Hakubella thermalkaliphila]|uniref:Uncharacterized protein n=1 Tax=Candidatus Hakubella thermalkaliphila TaxID=2754717 RepID=A0A6V8QEM6_9ACTN|nr:hypothetical protein [Candidatus Hakubella thermalkaliphila]GFP35660.1 hypothetical protein HKBW3S43_01449 [Candidatus Hakubella thermalkaliphila]GFP41251.1 hypothetical protein HKBW3C_00377 [Candidatus Hakubella thermalkaliphila]